MNTKKLSDYLKSDNDEKALSNNISMRSTKEAFFKSLPLSFIAHNLKLFTKAKSDTENNSNNFGALRFRYNQWRRKN